MTRLESAARQTIKDLRHSLHMRQRRLPQFRLAHEATPGRAPTVFYICPDSNAPIGGTRVIYRHVDTLNSLGIEAAVVHSSRQFRCTWFKNSTTVVSAHDLILTPADTLVVPEFYGPSLIDLPLGPRTIIFNQNAYKTFAGGDSARTRAFYANPDRISGIMVVSDDNADYIRYAFPGVPVRVIKQFIDPALFYRPPSKQGRRLAVMPRRRAEDCQQVLDLLAMRGCLDNWEVLKIDGISEGETAEILRSSQIFLSFSEQEGFGLPPAEAMACGCYVVGYTGLAGREYFDPAICTPVEEGNVLAFAMAAEQAMRQFEKNPQVLDKAGFMASMRIADRYSRKALEADLKAFFDPVSQRDHSPS